MSIRKIVEDAVFMSAGIAPIASSTDDANRSLASLPLGEARAMRRKFRKMWRKAAKVPTPGMKPSTLDALSHAMGLGAPRPTKSQRRARKMEVARRVRLAAEEMVAKGKI